MFSGLITRQLSQPSGLIGSLILAPLWNRRNSAMNDFAFEQLQLEPDDRVLEVGFGGGYLLRRLAGALKAGSLAGVDASPTMVKAGEKRFSSLIRTRKLELHCARAEALPFPDNLFTKVCSINSIFYWQDTRRALGELSRVLVDGGLLVLCFTSKKSLRERGLTGPGITAYEASEVERMLAEADFCEITTLRAKDRHRNYLCVRGIKHLGVPAE